MKYTKEQSELVDKTKPILGQLEKEYKTAEKEYKTFEVIVKFLLTNKDDFNTSIIKGKGQFTRGDLKRLIDAMPMYIRSDIQYGTQFSIGLTYNHIWVHHNELIEHFTRLVSQKL